MKVIHQDGKSTEMNADACVRGLRIESITLKKADIPRLLNMHGEDLVILLLNLDTAMNIPPKSRQQLLNEMNLLYREYYSTPIDVERAKAISTRISEISNHLK